MPPTRLHYRRPPGRKGIELFIELDGRTERYEVIDVSSSGLRARGNSALPAGERLPMVFRTDDVEIRATGELVWSEERDVLYDDYTMGIRYFPHDDEGREELERFLATF